jgi:hypothetical protein
MDVSIHCTYGYTQCTTSVRFARAGQAEVIEIAR